MVVVVGAKTTKLRQSGRPSDGTNGARLFPQRDDRSGFTGPRSRPRARPERGLHHLVRHPRKQEGIDLIEVLDRMEMQFFIRGSQHDERSTGPHWTLMEYRSGRITGGWRRCDRMPIVLYKRYVDPLRLSGRHETPVRRSRIPHRCDT
jgi:hypothetical protein